VVAGGKPLEHAGSAGRAPRERPPTCGAWAERVGLARRALLSNTTAKGRWSISEIPDYGFVAMNLIGRFRKPEYIFRPGQALRRLGQLGQCRVGFATVALPWGMPLTVRIDDDIGRAIWHSAVYDLAVSEVLWRLIDPGAHAVDVGAHVGYMSSIMAARVGRQGAVDCFEPHPGLFDRLNANVSRWRTNGLACRISTHCVALSDRKRQAFLRLPPWFERNEGTASLVDNEEPQLGRTIAVGVDTLDEVLAGASISVLKLDVEGHELQVLAGANESIARDRIPHIVFEEHRGYPAPTTNFLESRGYQVYRVDAGLAGPRLSDPKQPARRSFVPMNFLASRKGIYVLGRFKRRGWFVLRGRSDVVL